MYYRVHVYLHVVVVQFFLSRDFVSIEKDFASLHWLESNFRVFAVVEDGVLLGNSKKIK